MNAEDGENNPLLQDLEHYLQQNGLRHQDDSNNVSPTLDQSELLLRIQEGEKYKEHVLHGFLEKDKLDTLDRSRSQIDQKNKFLDLCHDQIMLIVTSKESIRVPLFNFVKKCDTVFALAKSDQWLSTIQDVQKNEKEYILTFTLDQFDHNAVLQFIELVQERETTNDIDSENIIECCRIAHFLQSQSILDLIIDIIKQSIDAHNCASICALADQLQIPTLYHASMELVMDKLHCIKSHDIWNDFPQSLQHQIQTLYNAAHSSIIGRGHTSKVAFTSSDEFLAIFSDTMREQKERLFQAKLRQEEIIQERIALNERRNRHAKEVDVYSGDVKDAAFKIERQEVRIQTLESFYKEQKLIFTKDAAGNGHFKSFFSL